MRTLGLEGAVFESVDEEIEGAGGGGLIGLEAGHAGESGLASEVFGELIDAGLFEQGHEDQGTQHGDGIEGGATSGVRGIEAVKHLGERIEIELEQHQSGLEKLRGEASRLAFLPFVEPGGKRALVDLV